MRSVLLTLALLLSCPSKEVKIEEVEDFIPLFNLEDASIHPSRCSYEDCLCTVSIPPYSPVQRQVTARAYESAYFQEAEFRLTDSEKQKVEEFISGKMHVDTILVVGYTDGCGDYDFNKVLSLKRAKTTSSYIRSLGFRNKIIISGMSEITSSHSDVAKRVDIITSDNFTVNVLPPNLTADHYLLDASGSIRNYREWINVISANKKRSSKLHLSYVYSCVNGTSAEDVTPGGGTEIWYAYWQVLDKMRPGQTLLILSDFNSRYPLSPNETRRFHEKVREKGVKVYAIRI